MTHVALVPWQGPHQVLMTARDDASGALMIHRQPLEDMFLPSGEALCCHRSPLLACGERETGRRYPQGDKILLLDGGERARQLPAFSANNLPAHARETGRKSSPGAGLRVGEGVKSAR